MKSTYQALSKFSSYELIPIETPIQHLERLSKYFDGPEIYIKRDDLDFIGVGGNKLRKLEYFLGDAKDKGADTIVAMGALQSNHARLTAAASLSAGFGCELILQNKVSRYDDPFVENGNVLLNKILGVKIHNVSQSADLSNIARRLESRLISEGKKPYIIPFGGSSSIGCLGYIKCAEEIEAQMKNLRVNFDYTIVPNGSSGTHAGLLAGFSLLKSNMQVKGYSVMDSEFDTAKRTLDLANNTLRLIGSENRIKSNQVEVDDRYLGGGYGVPNRRMIDAIKTVANLEGLFLDPVYSGKAFAGLIAGIKMGRYKRGQKVLFVLTGGAPGLFAYQRAFNFDDN